MVAIPIPTREEQPSTAWWAHSRGQGWVVLDRSRAANRTTTLPEAMEFTRCADGSTYTQGEREWDYQAAEAYRICVDKANELGVYNKWSIRALDKLQSMRPDEYSPLVERTPEVGFTDRLVMYRNGPVIAEGRTFKEVPNRLDEALGPPEIPKEEEPKPENGAGEKDGTAKQSKKKGAK